MCGGGLADRQTLNSYDDPDELSVVPIITASLSNLLGHRPNMLQTCSGIPLVNTFDSCVSYATRIIDHYTGNKILAIRKKFALRNFPVFYFLLELLLAYSTAVLNLTLHLNSNVHVYFKARANNPTSWVVSKRKPSLTLPTQIKKQKNEENRTFPLKLSRVCRSRYKI